MESPCIGCVANGSEKLRVAAGWPGRRLDVVHGEVEMERVKPAQKMFWRIFRETWWLLIRLDGEGGIQGDSRISNLINTLDNDVLVQLVMKSNVGEWVGVQYGIWRVGGICGVAKWRDVIGSWTWNPETLQRHLDDRELKLWKWIWLHRERRSWKWEEGQARSSE